MRSRGCWDAPGAVEEGVAQRGEDGDVVRPGGGDVGTDAAEGLEPAHAPPAPADLRLELGHSDGLFAAVVGPVDVEVDAEVQHLVDPLGHPVGQLVGLLAAAGTPTPPSRASPPTALASKAAARRPTSWPNGWPSGSTRCGTSASTSTSTGPTTAASRPSGWPSSRRRSAGAGGACAGSRPSAASVPTSPPPGRTTSPSSSRCATPSWTAPGASQQPRDRIGQHTRSRTPLNGYVSPKSPAGDAQPRRAPGLGSRPSRPGSRAGSGPGPRPRDARATLRVSRNTTAFSA